MNQIYKTNLTASNYFHNCLYSDSFSDAYSYLRKRGLNDNIIKKFGLGYVSRDTENLLDYMYSCSRTEDDLMNAELIRHFDKESGKLRCLFIDRITIPIKDEDGNIVGFGGRILNNGMPRFLNSPNTKAFKKSRALFGIDTACKSMRDNFILCEGYFDVMLLHQNNYDNAVTSLGANLTREQAQLLKKYKNEVVICYDSDEAGRRGAERSAELLKSAGLSVKIMTLEKYKDPDEAIIADAEYFKESLAKAEAIMEY